MVTNLIAKTSRTINASTNKVWQALTDPALIKQYLFGTDTTSDWKKGSSITYSGIWKDKPYTDKGRIVDIVPEKLLHTTYLSGMSGKEDKPENYANVIYEIESKNEGTFITISQDNIDNEDQLKHMQENWTMVLDGMKKLLEK
ncbi:MAG: SRPBCC domain-containing protein [Chitinophagales bacterium]|nr:SRPBCC domain-containing protein [Chitinophagales bacterium]